MTYGADKSPELGVYLKRVRTLHYSTDFNDLHLVPWHGAIVGAGGFNVYDQVVIVADLH